MFSNGTKTATQARTTISSATGTRPTGFSAGSLVCLLSKKRFQWARRPRATMNSSLDSQKTTSLSWGWRGNLRMELHAGRFRPIPPLNRLGQMRKEKSCVRWPATNPRNLAEYGHWTNTKHRGVETLSYLFEMGNGLSASGVWLKGIVTPEKAPVTIVLNDQGRKAAASDASECINRDEQVLVLDLTFFGDAWKDNEPFSYAQILDGEGDRLLGMQAAQLLKMANWLRERA